MEVILLDPEFLHTLYKLRPQLWERLNESDPEIYKSGDQVCCLSGCNAGNEIYGFGKTVEHAIEAWERSYQQAHHIV